MSFWLHNIYVSYFKYDRICGIALKFMKRKGSVSSRDDEIFSMAIRNTLPSKEALGCGKPHEIARILRGLADRIEVYFDEKGELTSEGLEIHRKGEET